MWNNAKKLLGLDLAIPYYNEVLFRMQQSALRRNLLFHLFVAAFELFMMASISLRPGGPFINPRRTAYFFLYLALLLATLCTMWFEARLQKNRCDNSRHYFVLEAAYIVFICLWGVAVTLNDQLGGNGLTVYTYITLTVAIMSMMRPWKTSLLILGSCFLLNVLLPYFPDPYGLDQSYNNLMNSLLLALAATAIAITLFNSRIQAKVGEIIIQKQYEQIETQNKKLSKEARCDALTGLRNLYSYKNAIEEFSDKGIVSFACIYIDVNGLHEINNYLGHQAGDTMLKTMATILSDSFLTDEVFRIGGDEFVVFCKDVPRQIVLQKMDSIQRQVEEKGYSISVGIEWRSEALDIPDIVKAAESNMQSQKAKYYSNRGGERQKRMLNEQMERLISNKKDADLFLSVLAPAFKGVYFVNLETDTLRHLFIPSYFKNFLKESDYKFSKALLLYAHRLVEPEYLPLFEQLCDYSTLSDLLDRAELPELTYRNIDGTKVKLRVLNFYHNSDTGRETLWIFSDINNQDFTNV